MNCNGNSLSLTKLQLENIKTVTLNNKLPQKLNILFKWNFYKNINVKQNFSSIVYITNKTSELCELFSAMFSMYALHNLVKHFTFQVIQNNKLEKMKFKLKPWPQSFSTNSIRKDMFVVI